MLWWRMLRRRKLLRRRMLRRWLPLPWSLPSSSSLLWRRLLWWRMLWWRMLRWFELWRRSRSGPERCSGPPGPDDKDPERPRSVCVFASELSSLVSIRPMKAHALCAVSGDREITKAGSQTWDPAFFAPRWSSAFRLFRASGFLAPNFGRAPSARRSAGDCPNFPVPTGAGTDRRSELLPTPYSLLSTLFLP